MKGRLQGLLDEITAPSGEGVFNVRRLGDSSAFYVGRDSFTESFGRARGGEESNI